MGSDRATIGGCAVAAEIHQAGHSAYFEKPQEVNRLVLDFIARHARY